MFKRKRSIIIISIMLMALVFTACSGDNTSDMDEELYNDISFELEIEIGEEVVKITEEDLEDIGLVFVDAINKGRDGTEEENQWLGMKIKDVLKFVEVEEYDKIKAEAVDGFNVEYYKEIVNSDGTIIAVKKDGEVLGEDSGPLQIVVEGERPNLWLRQLVKLKIED